MQMNREDVGKRYLELKIPVPQIKEIGITVSEPFRTYYTALAESRFAFAKHLLDSGQHHFFVSGAEAPDPEELALVEAEAEDGVGLKASDGAE